MRYDILRTCYRLAMMIALFGVAVSKAQADSMTPSYSVTDLGSGTITATAANGSTIAIDPTFGYSGGGNQILSADANGSPIASISNGQSTYAFNLSPATVLNPNQPSMANFPLIQPAPVDSPFTYGNPSYAFSTISSAIENANGIVVATDYAGVNGHYEQGEAYYVQQNPGGTWSLPVSMWSGNSLIFPMVAGGGMSVTGLNNLNQVLGTMGADPIHEIATDTVLYNINNHNLTDLSTYLLSLPQPYFDVSPLAIDDQGRILLSAVSFSDTTGFSQDTLLLTPDGVSSDPIVASTPEPGSWAVMALAMAAFAAHRIRESRRPS
ncbi:MAG: hypothetical protein ACLQGP_26335 [Isosphaeraceae bacterium]